RAQRLLPLVEGADPNSPIRVPLLARMDDAVRLVESLGGAPADVGPGFLMVIEAGNVRSRGIDFGDAGGDPLGNAASNAGRFLDPDRRDRPQPLHFRRLPEQRKTVRG